MEIVRLNELGEFTRQSLSPQVESETILRELKRKKGADQDDREF
jgi:hypothetical protein